LADFLLWLHIAGAGTWLGANIVQAVAPPLAAAQGAEVAAGWFRIGRALGSRLYLPAGVIVLLTGVGLVLDSEVYGFGDVFVGIGFSAIVIGIILGNVFIDRAAGAAAEAVESGDAGRIRQAASRLATFGTIDTLILLFTIYAMVSRLGT
jgi:hypothetical protein